MNDTTLVIAALSSLSGALISFLFSYVPKVKEWYATKTKKEKKLWMLASVLVSSVIVWLIGCGQLAPGFINLSCDTEGFSTLVLSIFLTISSNQSFYKIMPQPEQPEEGTNDSTETI